MARSHWIAFGACPALLAIVVAACSSSDGSEATDSNDAGTAADTSTATPVVDSGSEQDSAVDAGKTDPGPTKTPKDTQTAGLVSETSLNFGTTDCGKTATAKTFQISNPSTTGYIEYSLTPTYDAHYDYSSMSGQIEPGQKAVITVTPRQVPIGAPTSPTSTSPNGLGDNVAVTAGTALKSLEILQTAHGAILTFDPIAIDFKNAPALDPKITITQQLAVQNAGNADATVTLTKAGDNVFDLPTTSLAILGGNRTETPITFTPAAAQTYNGTVTMAVQGTTPLCAELPEAPLAVQGTGVNSVIATETSSLLFGTTNCGEVSPGGAKTFRITNYGGKSATITQLALTKGSAYYTVSINPAISTPLAANGGFSAITITPKQLPTTGDVSDNFYGGTLSINTSYDGSQLNNVVDIRQSARGAIITRTPASVPGFGNVGVGRTASTPVVWANAGNVDITFNTTHTEAAFGVPASITIGKATLVNGVTTATTTNTTFSFAPPAIKSTYPDTVSFARADTTVPFCAAAPSNISLSGAGVAPVVTYTATSQDFGYVPCGGTSAATKTVTFTNNGPATAWTAAMRKGASSQFTVTPTNGNVAMGGTVTLTVSMVGNVPTSLANVNAITDNLDFAATGTATVSPAFSVTPQGAIIQWLSNTNGGINAYGYGSLSVAGGASATYNFGIKNSGNQAATFTFAFANGSSPYFTTTTTTTGADVTPGGSFTPIPITFKPLAKGGVTANFVGTTTVPICNASTQSPSVTLALTGTGT